MRARKLPVRQICYADSCFQVMKHLKNVAKYTGIWISAVVGGMSLQKQIRLLSKGPDIVVATPGRLWEIINEGKI